MYKDQQLFEKIWIKDTAKIQVCTWRFLQNLFYIIAIMRNYSKKDDTSLTVRLFWILCSYSTFVNYNKMFKQMLLELVYRKMMSILQLLLFFFISFSFCLFLQNLFLSSKTSCKTFVNHLRENINFIVLWDVTKS